MIKELIARYPQLRGIEHEIVKAASLMEEVYRNGGKILVCGNGGSCADSDHIVGELMKGFLKKRPLSEAEIRSFSGLCDDPKAFAAGLQGAIPAISLTAQTAIMTAFINDVDADMVYAQLAYGYATQKDLLIGLSTSGSAKNVANAVVAAKARGAKTIALTGGRHSRLSALCDVTIMAPETETYKIQELHLPIYHYLCAQTEARIFGNEE